MRGNEARVVHKSNGSHDELAVHSVGHAAMSRNRVAKVLDLEGTLQSRCEEATEWSDQRGEGSERQDMELDWFDGELLRDSKRGWDGEW